jgi:hypothetical protein
VAAVGLLGALLAACGGSGASKADGGGDGVTVCGNYAQKYCNQLQVCAPGIFPFFGFATVADCAATYGPECKDALTAPHTGATVALVQQCSDQLAALSCAQLLQGGAAPACFPRGGTIANGGACSSEWQCASGRCSVQSIGSCGTCVPAVPLGQSCDPNGVHGPDCADTLFCGVTSAGTTPVCGKSVALGAACADTALCPANSYCDGTTKLCTPLPAVGQTCDPSTIVYCDLTKAAASCDATTSRCKPVTVTKAGESCAPPTADTDVWCIGSCDMPADAGQDAGFGTCTPYVFEGQPCTSSDVCFADTSCTGGVCTAPVCGGAASSGSDAAMDAGPPARSAMPRRNLIRVSSAPLSPAFWTRH